MTTLSTSLKINQQRRPVYVNVSENDKPAHPNTLRPKLDVWTAFRIGMRLKTGSDGSLLSTSSRLLKLLPRPVRLSRALTPIDLVRWREFDFALDAVMRHMPAPRNVLDVSSPKLVPLTIASHVPGCHVVATDILDIEVDWVRKAGQRLGLMNLTTRTEDARQLRIADNRFDLVTSISVIEHIAPERDGELPAVREISRVLAPGGVAIITVPFSRNYFAEYVGGAVYERTTIDHKPNFFQRFYDHELLMRNIVGASGLELLSLRFIEERLFFRDPHTRVAKYVNASPRQNFVFGPLYPLISRVFLSPPKPLECCAKPYIACIVLRKPPVQ